MAIRPHRGADDGHLGEPWCWKCLLGELGCFGLASSGLALLLQRARDALGFCVAGTLP